MLFYWVKFSHLSGTSVAGFIVEYCFCIFMMSRVTYYHSNHNDLWEFCKLEKSS